MYSSRADQAMRAEINSVIVQASKPRERMSVVSDEFRCPVQLIKHAQSMADCSSEMASEPPPSSLRP
ncbi:hypothetical protein PGT21_012673 [Puccinia graminis f. sp. tritici]|uniref:Uncharacterized protein n=1 Tax=Puccinia graminis f. sp. tritici TaxID=56615 RepID=A0A5B0QID3_PUCGR|nr:hypothetical protein PGT21_012673 [Puccinia graminis f. sp. tritici]KAA1135698.1 hypothetical protein PGTUg99_006717 [Puccinia graminis f. sp. tritici]